MKKTKTSAAGKKAVTIKKSPSERRRRHEDEERFVASTADSEAMPDLVDKNTLKRDNRRLVLDMFRKNLVMTVAEVAAASGLSKPTVHRAAEYLKKKQLLLTAGKGASGDEGGKKPILLSLNAGYRHIFTHQILGQGLLSGVSDLRGKLLAEHSTAFPPNTDLPVILEHMTRAAENMARDLRLDFANFAGVVVGCHGVTDSAKGVIEGSPCYPVWGKNVPFQKMVAELLPVQLPIYMDNSNRYDAYAEMRVGVARGHDSFLVMDGESDGLGAGLVLGGQVWRGVHYLAGEIGHMVVDSNGTRKCHCGARGCLETMTNMNALVDAARQAYRNRRESLLFSRMQPGEISYLDVYNAAHAGDALAREIVDNQAKWLAIGVVNVAMVADPELIILQGPYAKGGEYLLQRMRHHIGEYGLPRLKRHPDIVLSSFGRERGLVGGAHYVADIFFSDNELYS